MVEERREVVSEEYVDPAPVRETVVETPTRRVVQEPVTQVREPSTTYVRSSDPVGNSIAAGNLIQTVVWAVVLLVLLVVLILVLLHLKII